MTRIRNKLALALWGAALLTFVMAGAVLAFFGNLILEEALNRQTRNALLLFAGAGLALLVAVILGVRAALQRTLVRPISTLAETVEKVRAMADYHRRVPVSGADVVARLGKSLNAMLEVIQEREDELRRLTFFQRTILDNAAYGIVSITPEGIVSSFNPAVERLLGYTADEMVGKQTPACWHDPEEVTRHALRLSEELGETITPGFEVFAARARRNLPEENEWTFICKDGRRIPVNLSVTALRDEEGHITGFVGMGYDLTERKRFEEKLAKLNEELEQRVHDRTALLQQKTEELELANERLKEIDRLKSKFLASMSHELRTPLNSVIGFSTVMLDEWTGPVNAEQKQNLATILGSGRHLLDMINDILDVTQIEAGTIAPVIEELDLHDLLDEAVSEAVAAIREKGLELRHEPLHQPMRTDRRRLLQCMRNMLSNAVKFTDTGRVTLEARIVSSPGATPVEELVEIVVTDTGIGIGEADRSKIFDPFHRIVIPERAIVPGTGLGLFLTRKIATEILKGDIDVSSTYGTGSRFSLRIPVRLP